ncbi:MAG: acetyl-CoA carboxylase biotin carboxylase subunit [Planctomycetes bacterium]|nr:acetyl-CoA carboxylase biotin carboxylase subunit [Planctomycetota bacterium]
MFSRILIANRGEIALRIIRACRDLGVSTVAAYSQADRNATYLKFADERVCIGPAQSAESYLSIQNIISAAEIKNVQAIHPGYGFLAENPSFAEICHSHKIAFIGPTVDTLKLLGDKFQARKIARDNRVPVVPGSDSLVRDEVEARKVAGNIGYPVIIKAAAGGGGRGMRIAHNDMSLANAFFVAQGEAKAAFKDEGLYIEKYIERPRHVEVQILADHHGSVIHLGERDCSIQRRHQKLIEEAPCPSISDSTRDYICRAAVKLARSVGYRNAGTFEFIVDRKGNYYFIEGNARLQVEHPVTEMVTGTDIVKEQLRIASDEPLRLKQKKVKVQGTAIECRINAEDASNGFAPSAGAITKFHAPGGPGVRIDTYVHHGYEIPPNYDAMIGKLIVHQASRDEAIACMRRALHEFEIEGVKTTIPLYQRVFTDSAFVKGEFDTGFIEDLLERNR